MKAIYLIVLSLALGITARAEEPKFISACEVSLTGMAGTAKIAAVSPAYSLDELPGYSGVKIEFGGHTVFAHLSMMQNSASGEFEPTMMMQFFRGSDPVQGNISLLFARGMDFDNWAPGKSQSISSFAFGQILHGGSTFVRTDYSCKITRVK